MVISYSIRKYRFVLATIAFGVILLMVIIGLFSIDNSTNQMIIEYIEGLGWQIEETPMEINHLTIPESFDAVYETYNAVQKHSGFHFEDFKGKKVVRYTYKVLNHANSQSSTVVAGVFVFENTIIGGEISSAEINGFMHAITETSNIAEGSE